MPRTAANRRDAAKGNLAHDVVSWLRGEIISGRFKPGAPLAEPVLAARFQMSRAPVREALIELEREGLVQFETTGRTRVRTLTEGDFDEIVEARIALETMGARRAAAVWSVEDSAWVEGNLIAQGKAATLEDLSRLDVQLHEYVMKVGRNGRLLSLWQCIRWQFEMGLAHTHRLQQRLAFEPRQITVDGHRRLHEALASGKPEMAAKAMAAHIKGSLEWSLAKFPAEVIAVGKEGGRRTTKLKKVAKVVLLWLAGSGWVQGNVTPTAEEAAYFEKEVLPVLSQHCFECHSHEKKIKGALTLDSRSGWELGGESGPAIVPHEPDKSLLIRAIRHEDKDLAMPPKKKLSEAEVAVLTEWVKRGAPDPRVIAVKTGADLEEGRKHWAFQPLRKPQVPGPAFPEMTITPIDAFIQEALVKQGMRPAVLADRATLLRRAALDLTGLPPTAEETAAFVQDVREEKAAFAAVVDRLLASPAYGEKWGKYWLDLSHYADTTGCSSDWPIDDMWRYRDWVVEAFNEDKPFDQFLTEQLAGDLLATDMRKWATAGVIDEEAYRANVVATGFLATAKRFGSDPGGYDHLTIGDTLDTTWKALQGLSMGCARCHDHKFDPIKASDYYALYGIFASSLFPYSGAEKNPNAELLVPVAADMAVRGNAALIAWNRDLPTPGKGTSVLDKSRCVLSSSSASSSFEDHETSEEVADRKPLNPWVSRGSVVMKDGASPFTHILPKGVKVLGFTTTEKEAATYRRVRWENGAGTMRSLALDFQNSDQGKGAGSGYRMKLVWRPQGDVGRQSVLAHWDERGLTVAEKTTPLMKPGWHHLALRFDLKSHTLSWGLWNEAEEAVAHAEVTPGMDTSLLQDEGDIVLEFAAEAATNVRRAVVLIDNVMAESGVLPEPKAMIAVAGTSANSGSAEDAEKARLAAREAAYAAALATKPDTAFAMWEGTPRDSALQKRGEPEQLGEVVPRRNLLLFGGEVIREPKLESGRRDLARWMLSDENPLTLRVFVNRLWQWHFGRGLVATPNDFGHKGEPPTHPELLDYLVQRFKKNGLSVKAMHREIMMSHVYRQSSVSTAEGGRRDPENRWLAHFSPRRLMAEEVRDAVLLVSGRLDRAGSGYRQPFPPIYQRNWTQHSPYSLSYEAGFGRYDHEMRSLYLPVVRLVADPFLSTFDGADSNQSVAARGETAVPLQALALTNASFVVTCADRLAEEAGEMRSDAEAVKFLHRAVLAVHTDEAMQDRLMTHLDRMVRDQGIARQQAMAAIAQALLSSNAFLYVF